MSQTIHLGISTCPNDTFAFHGILNQLVDCQGLEFRIELLDVQQLNERLLAGDFDVAKASFHAALFLTDEVFVLPSGSALGFGNGPLLLASQAGPGPADFQEQCGRLPRVLCPGQWTTAAMLYRLFFPAPCEMNHVVFSDIMPALRDERADFGVCIHEGRFTWREQGLECVTDLGELWEQKTNQPLPLGGILARRSLGSSVIQTIQNVIQDSIRYGLTHREETIPLMRKYADEMSDEVLMAHVDLYVNEHTIDLGDQGDRALHVLSQLAEEARLVGQVARHDLTVFQ